jgi:hypothetical protein
LDLWQCSVTDLAEHLRVAVYDASQRLIVNGHGLLEPFFNEVTLSAQE